MIFRQYFMYYVYVTLHVFGVTISGGGGFFSVKSRNTRILQNIFFCWKQEVDFWGFFPLHHLYNLMALSSKWFPAESDLLACSWLQLEVIQLESVTRLHGWLPSLKLAWHPKIGPHKRKLSLPIVQFVWGIMLVSGREICWEDLEWIKMSFQDGASSFVVIIPPCKDINQQDPTG